MLLLLWGYATLSPLGKIALDFWAAGKLPKRKFIPARSGLQPSKPEVEKQREVSLASISFSGHSLEQSLFRSSEHSPSQVTASICLIHPLTGFFHFGG